MKATNLIDLSTECEHTWMHEKDPSNIDDAHAFEHFHAAG